jgi:hypothetical protein
MIYNLSNDFDRERFKVRCNALYKQGGVADLTARKERRTIPQNRYLHLILGWFALETGNTLGFVKQEYFKRHINPDLFVVEIDDKHLGKVSVLRSSRDLNTAEMTTAIERFRNWSSAEAGVYLPSPDEKQYLDFIEAQEDYYNLYL